MANENKLQEIIAASLENIRSMVDANTVIGNAALWSMLLAPLAIKLMGKRNLLITANSINVVVLLIMYFCYKNIILVCVIWYFNSFINTFWNIVQHNINADMRDYHQWKTGVRVDGLFGPLGIIGTFIGFFTGMFYPAVYEKMGLLEDYSILYNDAVRNGLFEVLILCSAVGAFLNLIPFCFYDLTENKHKAYVDVLKIRAMFDNYSMGVLNDEELADVMEIIREAKKYYGAEKVTAGKNLTKAEKKEIKEINLAIERASIVMQDLNKFSGEAGKIRVARAQADLCNGELHLYSDAAAELKAARKLPAKTATEKEIRSDAIKNARVKKEAASLINKYGADNITMPDISVKEEIQTREVKGFINSIRLRGELKAYLKSVSIYERVVKPYTDARNIVEQAKNYTHYDELEQRYSELKMQ